MRVRVWGFTSLLVGLAGCASGSGAGNDTAPGMAAGYAGQVIGASGGTVPGAGGFGNSGGVGPNGGAPPLGGTAGVPMGGIAGVSMGSGGSPPPGTGGKPPVN